MKSTGNSRIELGFEELETFQILASLEGAFTTNLILRFHSIRFPCTYTPTVQYLFSCTTFFLNIGVSHGMVMLSRLISESRELNPLFPGLDCNLSKYHSCTLSSPPKWQPGIMCTAKCTVMCLKVVSFSFVWLKPLQFPASHVEYHQLTSHSQQ